VALDREWRREKERKEKPAPDDSPVHGKDAPNRKSGSKDGSPGSDSAQTDEPAEAKDQPSDEQKDRDDEKSGASMQEKGSNGANGKGKSEVERVKQQHVNLRVKNLQCLGSLNEEVLGLQAQLRKLFQRGEGSLLPAVSLTQKDGVFDLVQQLLHAALAEVAKLIVDPSLPPRQVLERAFAFALALEHTKEVALSAEVKTHVLKLAALVDIDLLCQIIDDPFRNRLLALGSRRGSSALTSASPGTSNLRSLSRRPTEQGGSRAPRAASESGSTWNEAANSFCSRLLRSLRAPVSHSDISSRRSGAAGA